MTAGMTGSAAGAPRARRGWLVLVYHMPATPTRLRIGVWRRLKAAGALYLVDSVAALPFSPASERLLRRLRHDISQMGGSAQLLSADAGAGQAGLVAAFNRIVDDGYLEIIMQCEDFLARVGPAARDGDARGTVAAESALARLARQYERVRSRDILAASQGQQAASAVTRCYEAAAEHSG